MTLIESINKEALAELRKANERIAQNSSFTGSAPFELLTVYEVSRKFRCSTTTVWRWVRKGKLAPPLKICGFTRWHMSDVEAVVKSATANRPAYKSE